MTLQSRLRMSVAVFVAAVPLVAGAQIDDPIHDPITKLFTVELDLIASGLGSPNTISLAHDGSGRLFFTEQTGAVRYVTPGDPTVHPFLDLSSGLVPLNPGYDERGLLGLAFHPDFADAGSPGYHRLYTYASRPYVAGAADFTVPDSTSTGTVNHQSVIEEWTVDAVTGLPDPGSRREVVRIDEPQSNHNAGHMAFGPDGYLYVSLGDGGAGNDVGFGHVDGVGNAQTLTDNNILGKILRINPLDPTDTPGSSDAISANGQYRIPGGNPFVGETGADEIFAYGFRNPFRFSFDDQPGGTGNLIVGDTGQNNIEEIDIVTNGGNYGWHVKEGTFLFDPVTGDVTANSPGSPAGLIDPVLQYDHDEGIAVIGGFVYRGSAVPELYGKYIFGDLAQGFSDPSGRLFVGDLTTGEIHELTIGLDDRNLGLFLKGFGQDANGELYVLGATTIGPAGDTGIIYKIVAVPEPAALAALLIAGAPTVLRRRGSA